jgi:hypothetical protein
MKKMKMLVTIAVLLAATVVAAATPITVSVTGDYVRFQKGDRCFVAAVEQPQKLIAVHVQYPKGDFSEYILGPDGFPSILKKEDLWGYYRDRWAEEKEWKSFQSEWKQICKIVKFDRVEGAVAVDTRQRYTLLGTASGREVKSGALILLTFKVTYLNTDKEGLEVIPWERFKVQPEEGKPFLMGRVNGMLIPVQENGGSYLVKVGSK